MDKKTLAYFANTCITLAIFFLSFFRFYLYVCLYFINQQITTYIPTWLKRNLTVVGMGCQVTMRCANYCQFHSYWQCQKCCLMTFSYFFTYQHE